LITAGGILNATCGNVPELIIALFALHKEKMEILKWSLLGSILSNLLLVLGSSLLCGGLANTGKERPLDRVRMRLQSAIGRAWKYRCQNNMCLKFSLMFFNRDKQM
jgi:calcium/proton exchanger cax